MWSNAVFCADHIFIFSKRYTHVRVYSFKGSLAYYRELVKSFADFLSINILMCSFVFQFCTLKLHFKNTRKLFLSLRKICYAVNKEKGIWKNCPIPCTQSRSARLKKLTFFRLTYSSVFAAPPQEYFTNAIRKSASFTIHSFLFEIQNRRGTFSRGG